MATGSLCVCVWHGGSGFRRQGGGGVSTLGGPERRGPGRDPWMACDLHDLRGLWVAPEAVATQHEGPAEKAEAGTVVPGPPGVKEFEARHVSGDMFIQHDSGLRMRSGEAERGAIAKLVARGSQAPRVRIICAVDACGLHDLLQTKDLHPEGESQRSLGDPDKMQTLGVAKRRSCTLSASLSSFWLEMLQSRNEIGAPAPPERG